MTEEASHLVKTIKQMEASLDDSRRDAQYDLGDEEMKVTYPLNECMQSLKDRYNTVAKRHRERFEQVRSKSTAIRDIMHG